MYNNYYFLFSIMKRILFLSVIFVASCFCYGQRLNVKGQKMIKRIERVTENEKEVTGIIDFKYDKCNKLCSLVIKQKYNGSAVFIKNGNTMTRVDYNTKRIVKPIKYHFIFGNNGYIKEQTVDQNGNDGSVLRYIYDYFYKNEFGTVSEILRRTYYSPNGRNFETREGDYILEYIGWYNNNSYTSRMHSCEQTCDGKWYHDFSIYWDDREYSQEFENDTNVDFFELYNNYGNAANFENMTEWVGCKSRYLIERSNICNVDFYYTFDGNDCDNLGNIVKVVVEEFKRPLYIFKLYYVN